MTTPASEKDYGDIRIAARIVELRLDQGMTMDQFAEAIGISQPTQSRIERAKRMPDAPYLLQLRRIFGVDLNELLEGSETAKKRATSVNVRGNNSVVAGGNVIGANISVVRGRRKA
ncbi:helix-turn-helix domain-containing protein [Ramlibacter sp.]|uniref:helix-turn-helix domain-containing protein n=1 Tax=Ramlibacter sp. TaxID=1917967 RepID=UPI003D0E36BA